MAETLFNFHDLILLLTSFECLIFAFIVFSNKSLNHNSCALFAALLLSHAMIALHELVLWGATFREWVLALSPNIFFVFNFSYLLDGPLVYLFVGSLLLPQFKLDKKTLLHFLPVVIFLIYLFFAFWHLDQPSKIALIKSHDIAYRWHYVLIDLLIKSVRIVYVIMALRLIKTSLASEKAATTELTPWIRYLLTVFLALLAWEWLLTAIKVYALNNSVSLALLEFIGLFDYYAMFALINLMMYAVIMETINKGQFKKTKSPEPVNMDYVARIEQAMTNKKLFLNPNLSFERFSEKVDIPVKELSFTINRHFGVNFYEYINQYRISEARASLIATENADKNITEIFYGAGFNSKSVYNTLFKKLYKCTPSQYRKQALAKQQ